MEQYSQIVSQIIKDQEAIIGPIALEQAKRVAGLEIVDLGSIKIKGNIKDVLSSLVEQYAKLFGKASIEVCREAVRGTKLQFPQDQLPDILR
ncbi:MAG TPA: hypothetical protein VLG67_01665 [Candidatus Saccharimonadales bacterium]|nr:hypothetical protein [Candidatus Saccharimonadales bacterium]